MIHHIVLVLEGGGAKGPTHVGELTVLEKKLGCKLVDVIDLFVTTSIGGVEASVYCTGKLTVDDFWKFLEPNLKNIFTAKNIFRIPRYDWTKYQALYKKYVGKNIKFGDAKKPFMFTTVNLVDGANHFPKSWHDKYKDVEMSEIVHRTFAAPFFFGGVYDKKAKAIWSDGGVGYFNLPLTEAYAQALTNGWLEEGHHTHILALGTGRKKYKLDFDKEIKKGRIAKVFDEVKRFFWKDSGGIARAVSAQSQVNTMKKLVKGHSIKTNVNNIEKFAEQNDRLTFQWVDWFPMPKRLEKMDNWKARWEYYNKGLVLGENIDLTYFKEKLKK